METTTSITKNQKILIISSVIILGFLCIWGLLGSPLNVGANSEDKVLLQMSSSYKNSLKTEELAKATMLKAIESNRQAFLSRCEWEKTIAQYKVTNGYEPEREDELRKKTQWICEDMSF